MIADKADELAVPLIPACRAASDRAAKAAAASFPDTPETVDEEVVRNVRPTLVRTGVVSEETLNQTGHGFRGVRIRRIGVMYQKHVHVRFGPKSDRSP